MKTVSKTIKGNARSIFLLHSPTETTEIFDKNLQTFLSENPQLTNRGLKSYCRRFKAVEKVNIYGRVWHGSWVGYRREKIDTYYRLTPVIPTIKQLLKDEGYKTDAFGVITGLWFEVAIMLNTFGVVPSEWDFYNGYETVDSETYAFDTLKYMTANQLVEAGNYLYRLYMICKAKGLDY